jgi:hypothetical protein
VSDDEFIEGLSFPVYRRVSTFMFAPSVSQVSAVEMVAVDPRDLQAAQDRDAGTPPPPITETATCGSSCRWPVVMITGTSDRDRISRNRSSPSSWPSRRSRMIRLGSLSANRRAISCGFDAATAHVVLLEIVDHHVLHDRVILHDENGYLLAA